MPSFCPTSLPAATSSSVSLALPLSFAFFGMRVTCPSPGPLTKVSLALFHLQASSGTYRCVRMWIGSDAQSLFTLRRVASCTRETLSARTKERMESSYIDTVEKGYTGGRFLWLDLNDILDRIPDGEDEVTCSMYQYLDFTAALVHTAHP